MVFISLMLVRCCPSIVYHHHHNLLRHQATITRFSNSEYYNINTLLAGENSHKYASGRNPFIELGDGPVVCREEGSKASTVGRAESGTESVTFGAISLHMFKHAGEKVKAVLVWNPQILKD